MYSPKIRDDLIPRIHKTATEAGVPMTTWVNRVLERALDSLEPIQKGGISDDGNPAPRE